MRETLSTPEGPGASLLGRLARWAGEHAWASLSIALGVALVSALYAARNLELKTSRIDLLNPSSPYHQLWLDYVHRFRHQDDAVIVVQGADRTRIVPAVSRLEIELEKHRELFTNVLATWHPPVMNRAQFQDQDPAGSADRTRSTNAALPWSPEGQQQPFWLNDHMAVVALHLTQRESGMLRGDKAVATLRQLLSQLGKHFPDVQFGLTGLPVIELDEMRISQRDMTVAGTLSFIAVVVLFAAGMGGLRYPLLAGLALALGVATTLGFAALCVGHLNILSISFGVILVGLGIDFGIHLINTYLDPTCAKFQADRFMAPGACRVAALEQAWQKVGPPLTVGAVTTAAAFFAVGITDFRGLAELGWIAGGGVLICLAMTLFVLPALVRLADQLLPAAGAARPLDWAQVFNWAGFRSPGTWAVMALVTVPLAAGAVWLRFDPNLLNLQAHGMDSVHWEFRLLRDAKQSVWHAVSVCATPDEALHRTRQFERLPSVARVEELASIAIASASGRPQVHESLPASGQSIQPRGVREAAAANPIHELATILPNSLVSRFCSPQGDWLLRVFARGNLWEPDELAQFVREVKSVDPQVTGQPLQTYYATHQLRRSYLAAGAYAAIAVTLLLWLDLGRWRLVALTLVPVGLGLLMLFGTMGWVGLPLNPANLIVLPLIIGIGIDGGVHVVHDFLRQSGPYRLTSATAGSVVLTSLTTMVGFGTLMMAQHEGLRSLGRVLTLGVAWCLVTSLVMLPGVLRAYAGATASDFHPQVGPASQTEPQLIS